MKESVAIVVLVTAICVGIYFGVTQLLPLKHWENGPYKCITNMNTGATQCTTGK